MNAYLEEFLPDTEGQETVLLSADEIMDIIYSIPCPPRGKTRINEEGFNYADSTIKEMTDFFETREEKLEPKEKEKNLLQLPRNLRIRSPPRKKNEKTSTPLSKKYFVEHRTMKRYCNFHRKCSHSKDKSMDLRAMKN